MKADRYLAPHYAYYVREIKVFISTLVINFSVLFSFLSTGVINSWFLQVKAYAQLLESYRSLTLAYMAGTFVIISPELMSLVHMLFVFYFFQMPLV